MSHDHSNSFSCCCSHYPDLLKRICPNRSWEIDDCSPSKYPFEFSKKKSKDSKYCCKCPSNKKVKGKFAVAWICETPDCCCCEPFGWQVEFTDTQSKVEQKCRDLIQWINNPPLPKETDSKKSCSCTCNKKQNPCCCSEAKTSVKCQCDEDTKSNVCNCETPEHAVCYCSKDNNNESSYCCCSNDDKADQQQQHAYNTNTNLTESKSSEKINFSPHSDVNDTSTKQETIHPANNETSVRTGSYRSRSPGRAYKNFICCNEKCLSQVAEGEAIVNINNIRNYPNVTCKCNDGIDRKSVTFSNHLAKCGERIDPCNCCCSRSVPAEMCKKRMIWLPAHVTRLLLKNLKLHLNNVIQKQSCKCKDNVNFVCANKIVY